jgi:hypothetical protein
MEVTMVKVDHVGRAESSIRFSNSKRYRFIAHTVFARRQKQKASKIAPCRASNILRPE